MLAITTGPEPIGNETDAARALHGTLDYLDRGLFKRTYSDPDKSAVYKVIHPSSSEMNVREAAAANLIAEAAWSAYGIAQGVKGIPPVSLYVIDGRQVLAMPFYRWESVSEYIADHPGLSYEDAEARRRAYRYDSEYMVGWSDMGLEDLHGDNYRVDDDGWPVVTDMAGWSRGFPVDALTDEAAALIPDPTDMYLDDMPYSDSADRDYEYCQCDDHRESSETPEPSVTTFVRSMQAHCGGAARHNGAGLTTRMAEHLPLRGRCITGGTPEVWTGAARPLPLARPLQRRPLTLGLLPDGWQRWSAWPKLSIETHNARIGLGLADAVPNIDGRPYSAV